MIRFLDYSHYNFQHSEPPVGLRVLEVRQAMPYQPHDPYEHERDQTQVYAYEGRGSPAGSLSSLDSDPSEDLDWGIWGPQDEEGSSTLQGSCCDPSCVHQAHSDSSTDADEYEFDESTNDSDQFRTYAIENQSPKESWV